VQVRGANELGLPVLCTEQYPKALGHTVSELVEPLGSAPVVAKTKFSMVVPEVEEWLRSKQHIKQARVHH